jgi:hypothetical protein
LLYCIPSISPLSFVVVPACGKQAPYTIANLLFVNKLNKSILITYYLQSSIINSTGYIAQSNGLHFPWPTSFDGSPFPYDAGSPPEQWDALTDAAKWQILLFIGFLEWFSEAGGEHYMRGGKPGDFPNFSDSELIPHPVPLNLFDPFGFSKKKTEAQKAEGLIKELNNGRLAQIGIIAFLSEQKLEGSVPLLKGLVPHYSGEPMAPF